MGNEPKNTHGLYVTILSPEFLRTFPLFVGSFRGFVGHCFSDLPHHQTWNSREASGGREEVSRGLENVVLLGDY